MNGLDIALNHQTVLFHYRDLLARAEGQRAAALATNARPPARRPGIAKARAAVAVALLRAGAWLMPPAVSVGRAYPG